MFARILSFPRRAWRRSTSRLFLEFLMGHRSTSALLGESDVQRSAGKTPLPAQEGYAGPSRSHEKWNGSYGTGRNEVRDCMVHCGYEASAVDDTFGSLRGSSHDRATIFGVKSKVKRSRETVPVPFSHGALSKPAPAPAAFAKELPVLGGHRQAS